MTVPEQAQDALRRWVAAEQVAADAKAFYLLALKESGPINELAFKLYQRDVKKDSTWPEDREVTWQHWWSLQIDDERDEYRQLAHELLTLAHDQFVDKRGWT